MPIPSRPFVGRNMGMFQQGLPPGA